MEVLINCSTIHCINFYHIYKPIPLVQLHLLKNISLVHSYTFKAVYTTLKVQLCTKLHFLSALKKSS